MLVALINMYAYGGSYSWAPHLDWGGEGVHVGSQLVHMKPIPPLPYEQSLHYEKC